jgi:hypothetical protein
MNDQKILELIAKHGRVRAVQLADWLDKDLSDVSEALRGLVDIGDVTREKGMAPNGQEAMFYELSADFKRTQAYKLTVAKLLEAQAEPAPAPPAPEVPAQPPAEAKTKVDRAVAFVLQHGKATDAELRTVMEIPRASPPAAYLTTAMRIGRLHKVDGVWRPGKPLDATKFNQQPLSRTKGGPVAQFGTNAPIEYPEGAEKPAAAQVASPFDAVLKSPEPVKPAPVPPVAVSLAPLDVPVFVPTAPTAAAPAPAEESAAPVYRAALWSDGIIELQRDGATVLTCTRGEGEFLSAFLARTLGEVKAAA